MTLWPLVPNGSDVITLHLDQQPTTAEVKSELMHIGISGTAGVEGLKALETMVSAGSLKMAVALMTGCLDNLQLTVERVYFGHDVEHPSIWLVVMGEFGDQPPVVCALCQIHGLVVGRCLPRGGIDEPHGEWLSGGIVIVWEGGE